MYSAGEMCYMQIVDLKRKVCLVGDAAVGKTSLVTRFVMDQFSDNYITTVGTKVTKKEVTWTTPAKRYYLTMMIWDVIGQKALKRIHEMYFRGAKAAIVVCDITRFDTLDSVDDWVESLFSIADKIPLVILANKCDLLDNTNFDENWLKEKAEKYSAPYFMCSAKTGMNVEEAFAALGEQMIL